jgi:integrase
MPIRIIRRKDRKGLYFDGKIAGQRVRGRAQSDNLALAREEATALEAEILRTAWHGQRRGTRTFAEAVVSYLEAAPHSDNHKERINRLLRAVGDIPLAKVNQEKAIELKSKMLRPHAAPGTYTRAIVMPLRAVLHYAHKLGWCDPPHITAPRENPGRTRFFLPHEVERLIAAAARHLQPLLIFLIGTGARMAEAIELDWRDVDLIGARAIFWRTKLGKRRNVQLPPRVVIALANLPHRKGPVFRWETNRKKDGTAKIVSSYADRERRYGGHIKTGWNGAMRRAGLDLEFTPHDLRHSWASWHYAVHKDLLRLKTEGGWSSVALVERYAHLMPFGQEEAIRRFLSHQGDTTANITGATA